MKTNIKNFSPLVFLASLGAGGLSIAFFAFINYTLEHGKGLVTFAQTHSLTNGFLEATYSMLEVGMITFAILHLVLTVYFLKVLFAWIKTDSYKEVIKNPLTNSAIFAPFVSVAMTMNVFIASIRYFVPAMSDNFQALMLPGLIAWAVIWVLLLRMEIKVLTTSFIKGFDLNKINFGWLLQSFALGMVTVTGTGIAAMAQNKSIADIAIFMSLITGTMGLFLFIVKLFAIFNSQFKREGLPEKQFLPSMLIVVPNATIYAIALFRFGHYLEYHQGAHLSSFFMIVTTIVLAFETWYMLFGLTLLRDYFKQNLMKEFHVSQWGLICPFVAYAVLSSFVYKLFLPNIILFWGIIGIILFTVVLYSYLLARQYKCMKIKNNINNINTSNVYCN